MNNTIEFQKQLNLINELKLKDNYTPKNIKDDLSKKKIFHFKGSSKDLFIPICEKVFGTAHIEKLVRNLDNRTI